MAGIGDQLNSANKSLSRWAKKTTGAVSEWWDEVNAINERRGEIRDLAREREKLLVEMGTKVYTLHRRGKVQNRDLLSDCERIDGIAARIDRLEDEIAELKRRDVQAQPREIEIEDDSSVVADDDVDVAAAQAQDMEPEVEKESTEPCAHAQAADEGDTADTSAEREGGEERTMEPSPADTPETDKEAAMPESHAQEPTEGPADEAGAVDTTRTEVEAPEPEFKPDPAGDAGEPEVESEDAATCAHADAAAEGPADEEDDDARPGCKD